MEILVALTIFVLTITAIIFLSSGSQSVSVDTELNNQTIYKAKEQLENARATAKNNFSSLVSASSADNGFLKELIVENLGAYEKKVTSKVSWQITPSRILKTELATIISDWKSAVAVGGDTGGGGISGDWKNPRTLGSVDMGPGNSATGLDVINKIVYLSAEASDSKKPDFYIIDATNGQNPSIRSSINTGPGLNAVDVAGHYAYVANQDDSSQLQIIDVNNLNSPNLAASFKLPGASGIGNSIFYYNQKIYIGTKKATGPEFFIIDVTNPTNPISLGNKEINADVNAIYIKNNIAYLAVSNEYELKIFNINNPAQITEIGSFNAPGDSEDGKSLDLVNDKLYLGRTVGGNHANHHELHIFNVSNPSSIQNLGSKDLTADLNSLKIRDYLAFLATSDSNKEFQVWNISDPANIAFWSSFNFPQVATGIDFEDNIVYVSIRSNDALRIITSSP